MNEQATQSLEAQYAALSAASDAPPEALATVMLDLAWRVREIDLARARTLTHTASALVLAPRPPAIQGRLDRNLAEIAYLDGDHPAALAQAGAALVLAEAHDLDDIQLEALSTLGAVHWRMGSFDEGLNYFQRHLELARQLRNATQEAHAYNNLALIYDDAGDRAVAIPYYQEALAKFTALGLTDGQALVLNNLAMAHLELAAYPEAEAFGLEALRLTRLGAATGLRLDVLDTLGLIALRRKAYVQAEHYFNETLALAHAFGSRSAVASTLLSFGTLYAEQGQADLAIRNLQQALPLLAEGQANLHLIECHRQLAEVYEETGALVNALHHFKRAQAVYDQVFGDEAHRRLKNQQVQHETEHAKREAENARLRNAALEREIAERQRAEQAAHQRAEEMAALVKIGREISATLDLGTVMHRIASAAQDLLHATDIAIYLRQPDGRTLRAIAAVGEYAAEVQSQVLDVDRSLTGAVAKSGVAEIVNKPSQDPRITKLAGPWEEDDDLFPLMLAPLAIGEEVIGVITLWRRVTDGLFEPDELRFLTGLGQQAAIAITNARLFEALRQAKDNAEAANSALYRASITDELTQAYNRRYFMSELTRLLTHSGRASDSCAVVLLDIDDFKAINDTYGHDVGDHLLRQISLLCRQHARQTDVFARYGGEEFAYLLPHTSQAQACAFAERLRQTIANTLFTCPPHQLHVTISAGVAAVSAADRRPLAVDLLLTTADRAMYRAKAAGKNRVMTLPRTTAPLAVALA